MKKNIIGKVILRNDTSTNWINSNIILSKGEVGLETDTMSFKVGDGVNTWNNLSYYNFTTPTFKNFTLTIDKFVEDVGFWKIILNDSFFLADNYKYEISFEPGQMSTIGSLGWFEMMFIQDGQAIFHCLNKPKTDIIIQVEQVFIGGNF